MKHIPPAAWENGLEEAIKRLREHIEISGQLKDLDARDRGALAYVLWRLRNATEHDWHEPKRGPGRLSSEKIAQLTDEEKSFYGLEK